MAFIVAKFANTEGNKQQSKKYSLKVFRKKKHQYTHLCLSPIFINCKTIGRVSKLHYKGKYIAIFGCI
jgi:hypothetical protein